MRRVVVVLSSLVLLVIGCASDGEDSAFGAGNEGGAAPELAWQVAVETPGFREPRLFVHEIGEDVVILTGTDGDGTTSRRIVAAVERSTGELRWTLDDLDDGLTLSVSEALPMYGDQRTVLVLNRAERDVEHPEMIDIQLLDPKTGEPIGNAIPAAFAADTAHRSGVFLAGDTGLAIEEDRIMTFDGAELATLPGYYRSAKVDGGAIAVVTTPTDETLSGPPTITMINWESLD